MKIHLPPRIDMSKNNAPAPTASNGQFAVIHPVTPDTAGVPVFTPLAAFNWLVTVTPPGAPTGLPPWDGDRTLPVGPGVMGCVSGPCAIGLPNTAGLVE